MNVISQDAIAKIAVNKSLLKEYSSSEYSRVVYLNNGDEFQIQLFNSTNGVIAAKIFLDGAELSDMLVLRPAERVWLERYLDTPRRFKFSTYEVEETEEAKEIVKRAKNGEVKIEFYRVKTYRTPSRFSVTSITNYPDTYIYCNTNDVSPSSYEVSGIATNNADCTVLGCESINYVNCNCDVTPSSALFCSNNSATTYSVSASVNKNTTMETGRVEEGGYSNQKFSYVDYDFENYPFKIETIQILPLSRKPYTSEDLQKRYCSNCGRKLSPKHKFCPYCGTKVE